MSMLNFLHQFTPNQGDTAAVLVAKHTKLLFIHQVYEAWLSQAHNGAELQCPGLAQAPTEQECMREQPVPISGHLQSHPWQQPQRGTATGQQPVRMRQLLGTASTEEQAAADMQQQSDQEQPALDQQQQQQDVHKSADGAMLPPPPALQQPSSHKQLLARILQPGGASKPPTKQQQVGTGATGRQRRLQQGRHSLLAASAGGGAGKHLAAACAGHAADLHGDHEAVEGSPGPLQQQQVLQLQANYLVDAQSQAPGGTAAAAAAGPKSAANAALPRTALAAQQLFSPKTATHAPVEITGSGGNNRRVPERNAGPRDRSSHRCKDTAQHLSTLLGHHAAPVQARARPSAQPQQQQEEQPEEIEMTPAHALAVRAAAAAAGTSGNDKHPWGSGICTAAAAAATTAAASGHGFAAATTALHAAAAADTPATAGTELIAAAGSRRVAAAAAAGLAAALFHTPAPCAAGTHSSRFRDATPSAAGVAAAAATGPCGAAADTPASPVCVSASSPLDEPTPSGARGSDDAGAGVGPTAAAVGNATADVDVVAGSSPLDETQPPSQQQQQQQAEVQVVLSALRPAAWATTLTPQPPGASAVPTAWTGQPGCADAGAEGVPSIIIPPSPVSTSGRNTARLQHKGSADARSAMPGTSLAQQLLSSFAAAGPPDLQQAEPGSKGAAGVLMEPLPDSSSGHEQCQKVAGHPCSTGQGQQVVVHDRGQLLPQAAADAWGVAAAAAMGGGTALQKRSSDLQHLVQHLSCRGPSCGHAAGGAATAHNKGSSSFTLFRQDQRVERLHLGLPVVHIMCGCGYAAVVLQQAPCSSRYKLLLLHMAAQQQQQQEPQAALAGAAHQQQQQQPCTEVVLTAECASVLLTAPEQAAAATPLSSAARAAAPQQAAAASPHQQQQQHGKSGIPGMLLSGLLLLPALQASQPCAAGHSWQAPLLAAVSQLQVHTGITSSTVGAVTPTPTAADMPTGQAHIACSSTSSGKRKLLKPAGGASHGRDLSPQPGLDCGHSVNIFKLGCASQQHLMTSSNHQSSRAGAVLMQRLPTARPVRCLAVCLQARLFAAAGAGGFACVWPLVQEQLAPAQPADQVTGAAAAAAVVVADQAVADAASAVVLPAASYHGIEFPDLAEICFVVQGAASPCRQQQPSTAGHQQPAMQSHKVLLVGCCSQGPVAVWDVGLRQQVMSIHRPELRLSGLLPLGQGAAAAVLAALQSAQSTTTAQQQTAGQVGPVVVLATVGSADHSTPGAAEASNGRQGLPSSSWQQQGSHKQLRAVVLQASGDMQLGVPLIATELQGGVRAAELCGSCAAVLTGTGLVQVWDILSGNKHICTRPCSQTGSSTAGASAVALLTLDGTQTRTEETLLQSSPDAAASAAGRAPDARGAEASSSAALWCCQGQSGGQGRQLVLMGAADGVLTVVLL